MAIKIFVELDAIKGDIQEKCGLKPPFDAGQSIIENFTFTKFAATATNSLTQNLFLLHVSLSFIQK